MACGVMKNLSATELTEPCSATDKKYLSCSIFIQGFPPFVR